MRVGRVRGNTGFLGNIANFFHGPIEFEITRVNCNCILLLLFSFSFLSLAHELVHGRSQELLDRIS